MGHKALQFVKREPSSKTEKNAKRIDEIVQIIMQFRICFELFSTLKSVGEGEEIHHSMQNSMLYKNT